MPPEITSNEIKQLAAKMREHFLVPFEFEEHLASILELSESLPRELRQHAQTFRDALLSIHAAATLPFQLADSKVHALHFQRIYIHVYSAASIRNLPITEGQYVTPEHEIKQKALEAAKKQFDLFMDSEDGLGTIITELSNELLQSIDNPSTSKAAAELLFQSVVGLWAAFEVLARDGLIDLLNRRPKLATKILNDNSSRKYFDIQKLTSEELVEYKYDLSSHMGDIIFTSRDFSDIRVIKAAFSSISNDGALIDALNHADLWNLNQTRHLIVHRRGIVDEKYRASTSCSLDIGLKLSISPQDLEKYINVVIQSGSVFLKGLGAAISASDIQT